METSPEKKVADRPIPAKATAELFGALRKMINNPEFSDVMFKCQDGVSVCASRLLIMARSPALRSIVSVKKTREAQISLPEIASAALLAVLEFLYTATLVEHAPRTSAQAYQIINAARYFQLPRVEELVAAFLVDSTSDITNDASKAALRLSIALETGGGRVEDLSPLVRVLKSEELGPAQLRWLSEKAFRYFLQRTQHESETTGTTLWFGEYLRFRQVLLWCATQVAPDEAAEVVDASVLDRRSAQSLARNPSARKAGSARMFPQISSREARYLKSLLADRPESAVKVENLLGSVDFRRIHAELLDEVVDPLKIVPEAQLMEAFRAQALLRTGPRPAARGDFRWEHGSSYRTQGDGAVLAKLDPEVGFARFCAPITAAYVVYEWDIVVEELCVEFCEIGFYVADDSEAGRSPRLTGKTLAQQPTGWVMSNDIERGTRINHRKGDHLGWTSFRKDFAHPNARVTVRLDMWERCCLFSVDKDDFLVAWVNLPEGVYYPAVSLGNGETGRVRIELVSGFEMV